MPFFSFDQYYLLSSLLAIFFLQVAFFIPAAFLKTDKLTDLSYGLTFIALSACFLLFLSEMPFIAKLANILVIIWGVRLTAYLFIRILSMGKDPRFDKRREVLTDFSLFWALQALSIWVIMLPLTLATASHGHSGWSFLEITGICLWLAGFTIESVADQQKFSFKNRPNNKNTFIQSGLWKYSRHPNYFGESLLWWGIFIMLIPLLQSLLFFAVIGPVFIAFLLFKVTGIPPLEKIADQKYKGNIEFQKYKQKTNLFFPWMPDK